MTKNNTAVAGQELVTDENTEGTETWVTPYGAAKAVNEWLKEDGRDKVLTAQMFYNYTAGQAKKGKPQLIETSSTGRISTHVLRAWYIKYTARADERAAKRAAAEVEQTAEEVTEAE
jgi:hypothetical protein